MKTLDNYIGKHVLGGILLVLTVLIGLFVFFSFIEEVEDIGKQRYGIWQALQYVLLEIPHDIYELYPTAALLGSLVGLGVLANNSELTVIRASGISILRIALSVMRVGLILTLIAMLVGETLAPNSEQYAKDLRSKAQSEQDFQVFQKRYGFWARDRDNFINIRTILSDGGFGDISLYEFDSQQKLKALTHASTAYYRQGYWELEQVEKIILEDKRVIKQFLPQQTWNAILNPELVKIVIINPNKLSIFGLYKYINYLHDSGQISIQYEIALWKRLSYPLISITMLFLAIPFIFGSLRSVSIGQRILVGALLGIGFYMLNQIASYIGLVYDISPAISALIPPLIFLGLGLSLMQRVI